MITFRALVPLLSFFCMFSGARSQVLITEFQASNTSIINPNAEFSDWIELYNDSTSAVDIGGWTLSDDLTEAHKYSIPLGTTIEAKAHLVLWADKSGSGLYTNFKLSSDGEEIVLSDASQNIRDSITYGAIEADISLGRINDTSSTWQYFGAATPGSSNSTSTAYSSLVRHLLPQFSTSPGLYSQPVTLSVTDDASEIRYTTDGSAPTSSSTLFQSPIVITETTVLRARSFGSNLLPSHVVTGTYFVEIEHSLPIISLSTNPEYLWDDHIGMLAVGTNGVENYDVVANYNQDWKRPINFELLENGTQEFSQLVDAGVSGFRSNHLQKSIKMSSAGKYGESTMDYPFFPDKTLSSYNDLVIRNSGFPDFRYTHIRDIMIHNLLVGKEDIDYQAGKQCVMYLNGEYWGIYNLRERVTADYIQDNYGLDSDNFDLLEFIWTHNPIQGTTDQFISVREYLKTQNLTSDVAFEKIDSEINVEEFLNYLIVQLYSANWDWPANNQKMWRAKDGSYKWRWILNDLDFGFGFDRSSNSNTLEDCTAEENNDWYNTAASTLWYRKILEIDEIKNRFAQKTSALLNTHLSPEEVIKSIDHYSGNIATEIPRHTSRWQNCSESDPISADGCNVKNESDWLLEVQKLRDFANERPGHLRQHIKDYFLLDHDISLHFTTNDEAGGSVEVEGIPMPWNSYQVFFSDLPVRINAIPSPGYVFAGWNHIKGSYDTLHRSFAVHSEINPVFVRSNDHILPDTIFSNTTLDDSSSRYVTNGDFVVDSNVTVEIKAGVSLVMAKGASIYVHGKLEINGDSAHPVTIKSNTEQPWGGLFVDRATDTTRIAHLILENASHGPDDFMYRSGISIFRGAAILTNITILNSTAEPIFGREAYLELRNSTLYSPITGDLVNVKGGEAIVENCEFIGNDRPDTDAIDYDNLSQGLISNCHIHDFSGFNSDAIDLGEGTLNSQIVDNYIHDCTDKGISVGQASEGSVINNIIVNCAQGIGVKDQDSRAICDHNSIVSCEYGLAAFEKNAGRGAGEIVATNTIVSNSILSSLYTDLLGKITIDYSLSDTDSLQGDSNLRIDPQFTAAYIDCYSLLPSSPAIDAGDPLHTLDDDGSRTDMGAFVESKTPPNVLPIKINEVQSKNNTTIADDDSNYPDWIELYNPNDFPVDISNWYLTDFIAFPHLHRLTDNPPKHTRISAKGYSLFWANDSTGSNYASFKVSAVGETIGLLDDNLQFMDSLAIPALLDDESYGRNLDGGDAHNVLSVTSPGKSNQGSAPLFTSRPPAVFDTSTYFIYDIAAFDFDNDNITFDFSAIPDWLSLTDNGDGTAILEGMVDLDHEDYYDISISATDLYGNVSVQEFSIYKKVLWEEDNNGDPEIHIWPNPTQELLFLTPFKMYPESIEVTDLHGQRVYIQSFDTPKKPKETIVLEIERLRPGFYIVKTTSSESSISQSFIKM